MSPLLEQALTSTATTSREILGSDIAGAMNHSFRNNSELSVAACIQVIRTASTGNFEVRLEGGIRRGNGTTATTWSTVATITQAENGNLITFTIAPGAAYRVRHESGVAVTALIN